MFGELGRKGAIVLNEALKLARHPDDMARNGLMDGVISYSKILNGSQAGVILTLVDDPFPLVREKVIIYIAYANLGSLDEAIETLNEPLRSNHREGFVLLCSEHSNTQALFDAAVERGTACWR